MYSQHTGCSFSEGIVILKKQLTFTATPIFSLQKASYDKDVKNNLASQKKSKCRHSTT